MHASTFTVLAALSLVAAQGSTDIVVTIGAQTTTAVLPAWPTSVPVAAPPASGTNSVALGPGPIVTASSLAAGVSSGAASVISSAAGVISSAAGVISSEAGVVSSITATATATSSLTLTLTESVTLTSTLATVTSSVGTSPAVVVNATSTTTGPPTVVTAAADHLGFDGSMMGLVMFCILGLLML